MGGDLDEAVGVDERVDEVGLAEDGSGGQGSVGVGEGYGDVVLSAGFGGDVGGEGSVHCVFGRWAACAGEQMDGGGDEQVEDDESGYGVARESEERLAVGDGYDGGFAGLDGDAVQQDARIA